MSRSILVIVPAAVALATVPLAGCTRTHDGSIVPMYQTKMVRTGFMPHLALTRTPTDPGPRVAEQIFPQPPAAASRPPVRTRIAGGQRRPAPRAAPTATPARVALACRQEANPTGRVRVLCN